MEFLQALIVLADPVTSNRKIETEFGARLPLVVGKQGKKNDDGDRNP
jgi:hypothetical protein